MFGLPITALLLSGGDALVPLVPQDAQLRKTRLQAAENLPEGSVRAEAPQFIRPSREEALRNMQAMTRYFYITMHGGSPPPGEVYSAVEGSKGEVGFYVVSDGGPKPVRIDIRGPSFGRRICRYRQADAGGL